MLPSDNLKNIFEVEGRFKVELVLKVERKQNLHTLRISNPFIRKPQEDMAKGGVKKGTPICYVLLYTKSL